MSFSNKVKEELCLTVKSTKECKAIQLYGGLLGCKLFTDNQIEFSSEFEYVLEYFSDIIFRLYKYKITPLKLIDTIYKKPLYTLSLTKPEVCKQISYSFDCGEYSELVSLAEIDEKIAWNFIKGIFLSCGSVSAPQTEYHLEFCFNNKNSALLLKDCLEALGYTPKYAQRRENFIIYFKDSTSIEDILTGMGAVKNSLELMDTKVLKDIRNKVNRKNNCETANLKKTINVAIEQINAINKVVSKYGIDYFTDDYKKVIEIRIKNPEISLNEMSKLLDGELSKSAINRRLQKIYQMAKELN